MMARTGRRLGAAALLAAAAFAPRLLPATAASGGTDTGVVNMSRTTNMAEGEVPLAVDPQNPLNLASVSNTFQADGPGGAPLGNGLMSMAAYLSNDGGQTWRVNRLQQGGLGTVPNPTGALTGASPEFSDLGNTVTSDADAAYDNHGNLYIESGCLHTIRANLDEVAHIWHSSDGGRTFDGPYTAISVIQQEHEELDRPWFAVDNSGGPRDGTVYIGFETGPFTDDPPKVFMKKSTDHGKTWSDTVRVDDGFYRTQFNPRQRPVVGADGAVYSVYDRAAITNTPLNSQVSPIELTLARSTDGAATFERFTVDANVTRVQSPDEALPAYSEMIPAIAADPTTPGRVVVAWPEALNASNSRILARVTQDGGAHWSSRIDMTDDPAAVANQHDHVALHWLGDGRLAVGWRDRRNTGGSWTSSFHEWARLLGPDGSGLKPLSRAVELSAGGQPAEAAFRGATMPDEFQGLTATSTSLLATWAQPVGSYTDVVFRGIPLSAFTPVPAAPPPRPAQQLPNTATPTTPWTGLSVAILFLLGGPGMAATTLPQHRRRSQ